MLNTYVTSNIDAKEPERSIQQQSKLFLATANKIPKLSAVKDNPIWRVYFDKFFLYIVPIKG